MPPKITEIEIPFNPEDFTKEQLAVALTESRKQADSLREIVQDKTKHCISLEMTIIKWKLIAGFFGCMVVAMLFAVLLWSLWA